MKHEPSTFKNLKIWQLSMQLVERIYTLTFTFPKQELFGLCTQMQRASVSVSSNIAEGYRRKSEREYKRFLSVALGSLGELETQIEICLRLKYINIDEYAILINQVLDICKMTQSLIKKIKTSLKTHASRLRAN